MFFKAFTKCAFSFTHILFLHLLHWIIYVRFVESQVIRYLICLVSPVLVKVYDDFPSLMYGQVWQPCLELQRNVPAGGLGCVVVVSAFYYFDCIIIYLHIILSSIFNCS